MGLTRRLRTAGCWPAVAWLACLGSAALLSGACSGPPPDPSPASGELVRGNGSEPDSLDPQLARMDSSLVILRDAYEGLTAIAPDGGVEPAAAVAWTVSEDGLEYLFELHPDARWSNGHPLLAEDFAAAWRRLVAPATASQYAQMLEPVANARAIVAGELPPEALGVEAAGPHRLKVTLERPTPYFPSLLSHPSSFPVHRPTLAALGPTFARPGNAVTNGAYVPVEWRIGSFVRALRNRHYRDDASTGIDAVRYEHISDPTTELIRYRAGALDVTYSLPPGQVARLSEEQRRRLHTGPQLGVYYYGLAVDRPPFAGNHALRRALALAVDREILAQKVLGDGEIPAYGWVPPGVAGYEPQRFDWADWPAERRLAEARRLYAAAGYSEERPLQVEISYNKSPLHDRVALAVAAMWKQWLGARVTLRAEEFRVLRQTIDARDVQVFRASWIADYNDAQSMLQVLQGGFGINLPRYASARYDEWLEQAAATSGAERAAALAAAERQLLEDTPLVPLYFYVSRHLVAARVQGWYDNVMNVTYSKDLSLAD